MIWFNVKWNDLIWCNRPQDYDTTYNPKDVLDDDDSDDDDYDRFRNKNRLYPKKKPNVTIHPYWKDKGGFQEQIEWQKKVEKFEKVDEKYSQLTEEEWDQLREDNNLQWSAEYEREPDAKHKGGTAVNTLNNYFNAFDWWYNGLSQTVDEWLAGEYFWIGRRGSKVFSS